MFYILIYRRIPYMNTSCDNRVSDSMDSLKNIILSSEKNSIHKL